MFKNVLIIITIIQISQNISDEISAKDIQALKQVINNDGQLDSLSTQNIKKDSKGNIVIELKKKKKEKIEQEERSVKEGEYTILKDKVIKLLNQYQQKYPECLYIPPKLIPDEGIDVDKKTKVCKKNFKRGWVMGTNWAKLFNLNNYSKEEGWKQLEETGNFFLSHSKESKSDFDCAYRGLQQGYYNNFELLENDNKTFKIKSYDDLVTIRYNNLDVFYQKLKSKVRDKIDNADIN